MQPLHSKRQDCGYSSDATASFPAGPCKQVAVDVVGQFATPPSQSRFAITAVGYYTQWPEATLSPRATAEAVIQFSLPLFSQGDYPEVLVTDHGPQYEGQTFQRFPDERGIVHRRSSIYQSPSNGQVERFNRCLKDYLQTIVIS